MSTDTERPPIHWSAIPGTGGNTKLGMTAHWSAMALAYMKAYTPQLLATVDRIPHDVDPASPEIRAKQGQKLRALVTTYFHPALAAFSAACAVQGWSPEDIDHCLEMGDSLEEFAWQWLHEAGISEDVIERLTHDIEAPGVLQTLPAA